MSEATTPPQEKGWVGYCRVSTDMQAEKGTSIDIQKDYIRRYCELKGFPLTDFYCDEGYSAGTFKRPEFTRMLEAIHANKIKGVMVHKLDRFSRDLRLALDMLDFFQRHNVEFLSASDNFDTTSLHGKMALQMMLLFAELERGKIKERVTLGLAHRQKNGVITQVYPFGYKPVKRMKDGVMKVVAWDLHDTQAQQVKDIFSAIIQGKTYTQISKEMNIPVGTLKVILRNRAYTGKLSRRLRKEVTAEQRFDAATKKFTDVYVTDALGASKPKVRINIVKEWYEGTHPIIIDEVTFERVQKLLDAYTRRNKGEV